MLFTPQYRQLVPEDTNGRAPSADGYGVALDRAAAGAGYGAYTEVAYSDQYYGYGFILSVSGIGFSTVINRACVSIAYGSPGSEQDVVSDLLVSTRGPINYDHLDIYIPLLVPRNTHVSVKFAWDNTVGSTNPSPFANVTILQGSNNLAGIVPLFQGCDTYGITSTTANPKGTDVGSSTSDGVYGTPVLLGTTTKAYRAVILVPGCQNDSTMTTATLYNKLSIGSGGDVLCNYIAVQKASETNSGPHPGIPTTVPIPKNVSLYSSMANTTGTANIIMDWAAYCFY